MARSFQPTSGATTPRFAGPATFMRLPHIELCSQDAKDLGIGLVGVPFDGGTTNRPGARHAPRQLRDASTMIRQVHPVSGLDPFSLTNCADLGDCPVNPADLEDSLARITAFYDDMKTRAIAPLTAGGDHLVSLPILRALGRDAPLAMIQFDAHTDLADSFFGGSRYTHGTPFRRAIEEGLLDPARVVQIGIRGTMYDNSDIEWGRGQGVRIIRIEELGERGINEIMDEARDIVGDRPVYASFDIDVIDPAFAPGTGTPEIGGISSFEAQQMVRRLSGLDLVGADLMEVSPPFDPPGGTALVGASIMFELICPLAEAVAARR